MAKEHLAHLIRESGSIYGDRPAMRHKVGAEWKATSYREMVAQIGWVARGLLELGLGKGQMAGIFSQNRPEWALMDFGILSVRGVSVPIYATNTARQVQYIVQDAGVRILFVGDQAQYDKVKTFLKEVPQLKHVIVCDGVKIDGPESMSFGALLKLGQESRRESELQDRLAAATPDDLATLIYTSGTTGDPKGAMLTHANFFHQIRAVADRFRVDTTDRSLVFLPLSHVYERSWSFFVFSSGAVNHYLADPKKIVETMPEVRPTAMVSVPRLYEKIYATVHDRLLKASPVKRALFGWATRVGSEYGHRRQDKRPIGPWLGLQHALADRLVLGKIRDIVGGPKNFFSAGGAPLSKEIEEFFFAAGLLVCQGYGLTESSPMLTCNSPSAFKFGTVGKPVLGVELKIAPSGEILARGANIMRGYYNRPEATAETLVDGWLRTGDVGVIDEEGFLRITDRIKDLIKTSGGKYIAPQHVETMVGKDHFIEQIATIGDRQKFLSALIVPNFVALEAWAQENGVAFASREDLVKDPRVSQLYEQRIAAQSLELAGYEKIKKFTLLPREFSQDAGEITPTLKIKRKVVSEKYKDAIATMYRE